MTKKLKVFEAFAGVGSQRMALNNIGVEHEVVGIAEIDKFAIQSYEAIHGETLNVGDISEVALEDIPDHDLFTYSFPCQDISMAGKQGGLDEGSDTRSSLLWECKRVIEGKRPNYLLLENVKNLVGKRHKHNFELWLSKLEDLGYTNYWQVLNAKDYGIPQNRERVFVVSILGEHYPYESPMKMELNKRLKDILENEVDEKFYLSESNLQKLTWRDDIPNRDIKVMAHRKGYNDNMKVHHSSGINSALTTMGGGGREPHDMVDDEQEGIMVKNATKKGYLLAEDGDGIDLSYLSSNTRRGRVQKDKAQTLTTSGSLGVVEKNETVTSRINVLANTSRTGYNGSNVHDVSGISPTIAARDYKGAKQILDGYRIRKLTPKECWRLMGFSDEDFHKAEEVCSNSQLYKQAGNSIVVNVLEGIFRGMFLK